MGKKILFVDDLADWRSMVATALSEAGFEVLTAKDASDAMTQMEGAELGLVILDLDLAGESGRMLLKFVKHNVPGVPVLLFTSLEHDDATILAMMKEGADQYLNKGPMEQLILTVGSYFK